MTGMVNGALGVRIARWRLGADSLAMQLPHLRIRAQRAGTPRRGSGGRDAQALAVADGHGLVAAAAVVVGGVAKALAAPSAAGEHGAAEGAAGDFAFAGAAETAGLGEAAAGEDEEAEEEEGEEDEGDQGAEDGAD